MPATAFSVAVPVHVKTGARRTVRPESSGPRVAEHGGQLVRRRLGDEAGGRGRGRGRGKGRRGVRGSRKRVSPKGSGARPPPAQPFYSLVPQDAELGQEAVVDDEVDGGVEDLQQAACGQDDALFFLQPVLFLRRQHVVDAGCDGNRVGQEGQKRYADDHRCHSLGFQHFNARGFIQSFPRLRQSFFLRRCK